MVRKKTEMRPFGLPLLLSLILSPTLVGASDPIPLEPGRKQLFLDDFVLERTENLSAGRRNPATSCPPFQAQKRGVSFWEDP